MANVFENIGIFTIERLRTVDAAYLAGAIKPLGGPPSPIAIARGPRSIVGPLSAITAGAMWGVRVAMPAVPEVVWVVVNGDVTVQAGGAGLVAALNVATFGAETTPDPTHGPFFGGNLVDVISQGGAGTFDRYDLIVPATNRGIWAPLDPNETSAGWNVEVSVLIGATEPGTSEFSIDLSRFVLIGYPVNAWGSAALWDGVRVRGS